MKNMAYSDEQRKTFENEIDQLRKVDHRNIIKLIDHSITAQHCCLIMEYAECGNLYDLLHNCPSVHYNEKHALSWSYQTAQALAYLHNLKPRPLVHRDVKPPNLLLRDMCRILKICDFGTACDVHTHMTTNQGSAAWMAPEVFNTTSSYTEKCDTFSFGITLWQIFSRRKPFADQSSSFQIMWAVNNGSRPPLLQNCPQPLEELMTMCWDQNPGSRPSMSQVEQRLSQMTDLIMQGTELEPIDLPVKRGEPSVTSSFSSLTESLPFATVTEPPNYNTDLYSFLLAPRYPQDLISSEPSGSQENLLQSGDRRRRQSSDRNLDGPSPGQELPPPQLPERRRSNSFNNTNAQPQNSSVNDLFASRYKSTTNNSVVYDDPYAANHKSHSNHAPFGPDASVSRGQDEGYTTGGRDLHSCNVYVAQIDAKYRPLQPDTNNNTSMVIFQEHQQVCSRFSRLNTENKLLVEREKEIEHMERKGVPNFDVEKELRNASNDKKELTTFMQNLKKQLEKIKREKLRKEAEKDGFHLMG